MMSDKYMDYPLLLYDRATKKEVVLGSPLKKLCLELGFFFVFPIIDRKMFKAFWGKSRSRLTGLISNPFKFKDHRCLLFIHCHLDRAFLLDYFSPIIFEWWQLAKSCNSNLIPLDCFLPSLTLFLPQPVAILHSPVTVTLHYRPFQYS